MKTSVFGSTTPEQVLEELDSVKYLYYQLKAIQEDGNHVAEKAAEELAAVFRNAITAIVNGGKDGYKDALKRYKTDYSKGLSVDEQTSIEKSINEMMAQYGDDSTFYTGHGFGKYWNEVALPSFLEDFLDAYFEQEKVNYPGMIGLEKAGMKLPDNAAAVSFYNLSDVAVVFYTQEAAMDFLVNHAIEPSSLMLWNGNGWQC